MNSQDESILRGAGSHDHAAPSPGRRVMVIDDSRDARTILQLLLTKLGHEAKTAEDGPSGMAASKEFRPDLIFCDITMSGGMSGYAFAKAARQDADLQKICLVAISGWEGAAHEQEAYAAGFDRVLKKPVGFAELEGILHAPPRRCDPPQ